MSTTSTGGLMCARDLGRGAAGQIAAHLRRIGIDLPPHLLDRTADRLDRSGIDRVGGVVGKRAGSFPAATLRPAVFSTSACSMRRMPGQDHAAVKDAVLVERVDRDRRAGVDDDARRRKEIGRRRPAPRRDERRPAVGAELRRPRVAVGHAARGFRSRSAIPASGASARAAPRRARAPLRPRR